MRDECERQAIKTFDLAISIMRNPPRTFIINTPHSPFVLPINILTVNIYFIHSRSFFNSFKDGVSLDSIMISLII